MRLTAAAAMITAAVVLTGCTGADQATGGSTASPDPSDIQGPIAAPLVTGPIQISDTSPEAVQPAEIVPPTGLSIGALDLDMPIAPVGVADDGSMEIPESASTAGWYRFGATPGSDSGNVVVAAHVDDPSGLGPFSRIKELDDGDTVTVAMDDGTEATYRVTRSEQTSKQDVDMDLVFANTDQHQLVLVTCGGRFDWDNRHYEDNVVVWAEPVEA